MAEAANCSDDWELCKENVQPLRQGRSFTEMSAAIQPSNAARIKQEQEYVFKAMCRAVLKAYIAASQGYAFRRINDQRSGPQLKSTRNQSM